MTDLNYPIAGDSVKKIAEYLNIHELHVATAIERGAATYAEVYSHYKQLVLEMKEDPEARKKPKSKNSPFGKRYF